ncbi:MAG: NAD-dependent epimerase/dehydratase family protein [Dehalococcoidia bacterium]|nr:MAG: NAD-dependent epimerase/dehydratase family protein [Dehalococcoidia bacterium]
MRVLVTGTSGFVGTHLVRRLVADGHEVTGIDWQSPKRGVEGWRDVRVDIRDDAAVQRAVADARPEVVWHLAAQASVSVSMREPRLDIETNCIASVTLARAAAEAGARRFVFTSSGGAMFGDPPEIPARDDTPVAPRSIYGASKVAAERYLQIVGLETGMEIAGLRPGNIYGPYQDPHGEAGVVAIFTQRMLRGEPCTIFGTGNDTRDYVYVDDVVEAQVRAASAPVPAFCLVGTGRETSTREIFDLLARETGYERPAVEAPPRPGDIPRIALDTSRARDLWQWQATVSLADGMARTVAAFREEAEA